MENLKLTEEEWQQSIDAVWEIAHSQHHIASKCHLIRTILDADGPVIVFADSEYGIKHDMTEQVGFDEFDLAPNAILEFKKAFREAIDKKK